MNFAGRLQRLRKGLEPKVKIFPLGEVLSQVVIGLGQPGVPWTPEEIWQRLTKEHSAFGGIQYETIGSIGIQITVDR